MNWTEYRNYFKYLATAHVDINDFHCGTMGEVLADELPREISGTLLFLERFTKSISARNEDETYDAVTGALLILKQVPERDTNEESLALVDQETLEIVEQIEAKMKADSVNCAFLMGLDLSSMRLQYVAGVFDGFHGWRLVFRIEKAKEMTVDQSKWDFS